MSQDAWLDEVRQGWFPEAFRVEIISRVVCELTEIWMFHTVFSYSCHIVWIKWWYECIRVFQLKQKTITSLLNSASCTEVRVWTSSVKVSVVSVFTANCLFFVWQGCSVENVLGSEIGPLSVFVHVVNRSHTVWMGLEECVLHWLAHLSVHFMV